MGSTHVRANRPQTEHEMRMAWFNRSKPAGQQDGKAEAIALAKRNRFAEAIVIGTAENRSRPDEELERMLAGWRVQATKALPSRKPNPNWPPRMEDPFPGLSGLPEIAAADLTTNVLAGAILHHGALLVRGLISKEEAARLRPGIDEAFRGFASWLKNSKSPPTPWFSPIRNFRLLRLSRTRRWIYGGGGTWLADSPRMLFEITELLGRTRVPDMVAEYLGERPLLSVGKTTLRKVSASQVTTGWHQDGRFLGEGIRSVNLWLALSDCGRDAPGLDLVPKRIPYIVETGTRGAVLDWTVAPDIIEQLAKDAPVYSPEFSAGDALLFDHYFLHRTSLPEECTRDRYALECWMFAPSCFPHYQGAMLL